MPLKNIPRSIADKLASGVGGTLMEVVRSAGFLFGRRLVNSTWQASSLTTTRSGSGFTRGAGAATWRGSVVGALLSRTDIVHDQDGNVEFSAVVTKKEANAFGPSGNLLRSQVLSGCDAEVALIDMDAVSELDVASRVIGWAHTGTTKTHSGREHTWDQGSAIGATTWTLSVYAKADRSFGSYQPGWVRLEIALASGAQSTGFLTVNYDAATHGRGWVRLSVTKTFTANSENGIRVRIGSTYTNGNRYLACAQLESGSSATTFLDTDDLIGSAVKNKLKDARWMNNPGAAGWTDYTTSTAVARDGVSYAGPEFTAAPPNPGFLVGETIQADPSFPDTEVQLRPLWPEAGLTDGRDTTSEKFSRIYINSASEATVTQTADGQDFPVATTDGNWSANHRVTFAVFLRRPRNSSSPTQAQLRIELLNSGGTVLYTLNSPLYDLSYFWRRYVWSSPYAQDTAIAQARCSIVIPAGNDNKYLDAYCASYRQQTTEYFLRMPDINRSMSKLKNYDFEAWTDQGGGNYTPDDWTVTLNGGATVSRQAGSARGGGSYFLRVSGKTSAGYNAIEQRVFIQPGQRIMVGFWFNNAQAQTDAWKLQVIADDQFSYSVSNPGPAWQPTPGYFAARWNAVTTGFGRAYTGLWNVGEGSGGIVSMRDGGWYTIRLVLGDDATVVSGQTWDLDWFVFRYDNGMLQSCDMSNAVWTLTNCTVTQTGQAPAMLCRAWTSAQGYGVTGLVHSGNDDLASFYRNTAVGDEGSEYSATVKSVGSADGVDVFGGDGRWDSGWGAWSRVEGKGSFALDSSVYIDDQGAASQQSVRYDYSTSDPPSTFQDYLKRTVTLSAGWHTLVGRASHRCFFKVKRVADNQWLMKDCTSWGAESTIDLGVSSVVADNWPAWTSVAQVFYVESSGSYEVHLAMGVVLTGDPEMRLDNFFLYTKGGLFLPTPDQEPYDDLAAYPTVYMQGALSLGRGIIDDVEDGDDLVATISVRGLFRVSGIKVPALLAKPECQWTFRDANCGYQKSASITQDSSGTTIYLDDARDIEPLRYYAVGLPTDMSRGLVYCTAVSLTGGGPAGTMTIQSAWTVYNGWQVSYADCRRTRADCDWRLRSAHYGGFPGMVGFLDTINSAAAYKDLIDSTGYFPGSGGLPGIGHTSQYGGLSRLADEGGRRKLFEEVAVPVIYGIVTTKLAPIEASLGKLSKDDGDTFEEWWTWIYLVGEGEIEEIANLRTDDGYVAPVVNVWDGITRMLWNYRPGKPSDGFNDSISSWHTYIWGSDPTIFYKIDNGKVDPRTASTIAFNNRAHLFLSFRKEENSNLPFSDDDVIPLYAEVKGVKVQLYDSQGNASGSPAWSENPAWCLLDLLLNTRYGAGFPIGILDIPSFYTAAQTCDEVIDIREVVTTVTLGVTSAYQVPVASIAGMRRGMTLRFNGVTDAKIVDIDSSRGIVFLDTAVTLSLGATVQGRDKRYVLALVLDKKDDLLKWIKEILATFRGRLYVDAGKFAVAIDEADGTANTLTVNEANLVPGSFRANRRRGVNQSINHIEMVYSRQNTWQPQEAIVEVRDADNGGFDIARTMRVSALGCPNADQAMRAMLPRYGQHGALTNGTDVAFTLAALPSALKWRVGEFIKFSRNTPFLEGVLLLTTGRIEKLSIRPDLSVIFDCYPEVSSIRLDPLAFPTNLWSGEPSLPTGRETGRQLPRVAVSASITKNSAGILEITLTYSGFEEFPASSERYHALRNGRIQLHASTLSGFVPVIGHRRSAGTMKALFPANTNPLVWQVPEDLLETPIYIRVVAYPHGRDGDFGMSSELTATVYRVNDAEADPTIQQGVSNFNLAFGGDFDDVTQLYGPESEPGWITDSTPSWGTLQLVNQNTGPINAIAPAGYTANNVWSLPANVYGAGNSTGVGTTTKSGGVITVLDVATHSWYSTVWSGTKNVRAAVYGSKDSGLNGKVDVFYSLDGGSSWTKFGTLGTTAGWVRSGLLTGVNVANLRIAALAEGAASVGDGTKVINGSIDQAGYEEQTATTTGSVGDNYGTVKGSGTLYGNLRRRFPGKAPADAGTHVVANTINLCRIRAWKEGSGHDSNPLEVRIYDSLGTATWALMSIPAADLTTSKQEFAVLFSPTTPISGKLYIEVRTKNAGAFKVDHLGVFRSNQITSWSTGIEDQQLGVFGDFGDGDARAFTKGPWVVGTLKKSAVS